MGQKQINKQYSKEFKEETVALVQVQSISVSEVAELLGINFNILYRWIKKLKANHCQ